MTWYCEGVLTCIMQYHNNYPDVGSVMQFLEDADFAIHCTEWS